MKRIIYFIFALITIVYVAFLCYYNITTTSSAVLDYTAIYGGLVIALMYAAVNFFGNPLKVVFFILLILMVVLLILTIAIPDVFRNLLGLESAEAIMNFLS